MSSVHFVSLCIVDLELDRRIAIIVNIKLFGYFSKEEVNCL